MKRLADGLRAYAAAFRKREQRPIGFTRNLMTFLYVMPLARRQFGTQRHKATLTELRIANEQHILLQIDISQVQPHRLSSII